MLTIYRDGIDKLPNNQNLITDAEIAFKSLPNGIDDTHENREFIEEIEGGQYKDQYTFTDRFGCKLYKEDLSTGCKVAILIAEKQDSIIDTMECGINALISIITHCKSGSILIREPDQLRSIGNDSTKIQVSLAGVHCGTLGELYEIFWRA
jgi:hypothetical protein